MHVGMMLRLKARTNRNIVIYDITCNAPVPTVFILVLLLINEMIVNSKSIDASISSIVIVFPSNGDIVHILQHIPVFLAMFVYAVDFFVGRAWFRSFPCELLNYKCYEPAHNWEAP